MTISLFPVLTACLPLLVQERSHEEEEPEEKRVILVASGVRVQEEEGDRVPAAAVSNDRCVQTEPSSPSL